MNNAQFLAWLQKNDACDPAVKKLGAKSAQEVWENWDNPSELLWWVEKSGLVSKRELTLLICGIVRNTPLADGRTVWDLLADERSRSAVEVAERWAHGKATDKERAAAAAAAWVAAVAAAPLARVQAAAWMAARAAAWVAAARSGAWVAETAVKAWAAARRGRRARVWQLAYIREQLPDFAERFTEAHIRQTNYVHYYDGTIKKFVIPRKQWK